MRKLLLVYLVTQIIRESFELGFTLCSDYRFFIDEKSDRLTSLKFGTGGVTDCADYGKLSELETSFMELPFHCVTKVSEEGMKSIMKMCPRVETNQTITSLILADIPKFEFGIFPGTNWCGPGDIASSPEDLGILSGTDKCCRAHDSCFDDIVVGETKHGITNHHIGTISHCDCDEQQYICLSKLELLESDEIGFTYYDVVANPCFKKDYPVIKCVKEGGLLGNQCQQYELNISAEPIYQLFDAKLYYPTLIKRFGL